MTARLSKDDVAVRAVAAILGCEANIGLALTLNDLIASGAITAESKIGVMVAAVCTHHLMRMAVQSTED